jgi:uncharacterized membrane protein YgaE (UPF0421/DUF939 family)
MKVAATHQLVLRNKPRSRFGQRLAVAFALALVAAALAFFLSLFVSIVVLLVIGFFRHVDMTVTYRLVALPIALATFPAALIASLWWQTRSHRIPRT